MASITLSPTSGAAGSTVTVSGTGFGRKFLVNVNFNNARVASARTHPQGHFTAQFAVPSVGAGSYTVTASSPAGSASKPFSVTSTAPPPSPTLPGAPTGLTATAGLTTIDLNWVAPQSNGGSAITGYRIYRNGTLAATVGAVLTWQDTGRTAGTTYSYQVSALNAVGEGPKSSVVTAVAGGWQLIFSEDFNTPAAEGQFEAVYPRMYVYPWGYDDTSNNGHYDPSILSVHDGYLDVFIRTTNGIHRVAAFGPCLSTTGDNPVDLDCQQNQLYGRYEIRARADSMHGYKGAWLLWPKSEVWPRDGEIDFPEGDFDSTIAAFMHRQDGVSGSDQDAYPTGAVWTTWHTYTTEWAPDSLKFYLDGVLIGHSTSRVPNTQMRWTVQNETTLDGFEPADSVSGHIYIDWMRVWSYSG